MTLKLDLLISLHSPFFPLQDICLNLLSRLYVLKKVAREMSWKQLQLLSPSQHISHFLVIRCLSTLSGRKTNHLNTLFSSHKESFLHLKFILRKMKPRFYLDLDSLQWKLPGSEAGWVNYLRLSKPWEGKSGCRVHFLPSYIRCLFLMKFLANQSGYIQTTELFSTCIVFLEYLLCATNFSHHWQ